MADIKEQNKNTPDYVLPAAAAQMRELGPVRDLAEGTMRLREVGNAYLPAEPAEKAPDYTTRLARAICFNAFERTLHALVGMVFRKEPQLAEDVPEAIRGTEGDEATEREGIAENIDGAGSHWSVFAKELFAEAIRDGHAFLFVDMPPALPEGSTRADEIAVARQPYWVCYAKDQAINWRFEGEQLSQITFCEVVKEPDGAFGEKCITQYRVLRPSAWELWREIEEDGKKSVVKLKEGATPLDEIPVTPIYSRKKAPLISKPLLLDLALLNIAHYQKYSDHSTYLHIGGRPLLTFVGRNTVDDPKVIGPYSFIDVPVGGDAKFAETTGAAFEAQDKDLQNIWQAMDSLGMSVLLPKQPAKTATESILGAVRGDSDLATAARSLKDGLEAALRWTAQYLDPTAKTGGSVELGSTIEEMTLTAQEMQAYSQAVAANQLSLETMWAMFETAGKLPEDFDPEEERRRIERERAEVDARAASLASASLAAFDRGATEIPQ